MDLANKLINLRVHQKLSRQDLASKLNLSEKLIEAWEKGEKEPGASQLAQLSKIFALSIDELLGVQEKPSSFNPLAGLAMPLLDFNKIAPKTTDEDDDADDDYLKELIAATSAVDLARKKKD